MEDTTLDQRKLRTKYILITVNIIFGIFFIASIVPIMISPMIFDAPGSENYFTTWLLFFSIVTFPVSCLLSFILPWIFYKRAKYRIGIFWGFFPILNIILLAGTWTFLEIFCRGFACA